MQHRTEQLEADILPCWYPVRFSEFSLVVELSRGGLKYWSKGRYSGGTISRI